MLETNSKISNNPQNPSVPNETDNQENKGDEPLPDTENQESAINYLIWSSFYPTTCMVPLDENIINIKENVPELMKAKEHDSLLQETIKTFHGLMKEKDDEIISLRQQLKDVGVSPKEKAVSSADSQTELTLKDCEFMEEQVLMLREDIPTKNEKIRLLEMELETLKKSKDVANQKSTENRSSSKQVEELDDYMKQVLELEKENADLAKQKEDLIRQVQEVQWKFEESEELKGEVEEAKIAVEEALIRLKQMILDKDEEIESLKVNQRENVQAVYDVDVVKDENVDDLIGKLKQKILNTDEHAPLLMAAVRTIPNYQMDDETITDKEFLKTFLRECIDPKTNQKDLINYAAFLRSIKFGENQKVETSSISNSFGKELKICSKMSKEELLGDSFRIAFNIGMRQHCKSADLNDLQKEYMKLENFLNVLNTNFKLAPIGVIKKLSRDELIEGIIEKKLIIFEIALHRFWEIVLNQSLKENDFKETLKFSTEDQNLMKSLLMNFSDQDQLVKYLEILINIKNRLLSGSKNDIKKSIKNENLFVLKLSIVNVSYDLIGHILPKYPKEIRYKILDDTTEESIAIVYKIYENISPGFLDFLANIFHLNYSLADKKFPSIFSWYILYILEKLDFENDFLSGTMKATNRDVSTTIITNKNRSTKPEKSIAKFILIRNAKEQILTKIIELEALLNFNEDSSKTFQSTESLKQKSDMELMKMLIKQKELVLKKIFKETFNPKIESLSMPRNSTFTSSCSEKSVSIDFWIKLILDRYKQEIQKEMKDLSDEDLMTSFNRLMDAIRIVRPQFKIVSSKDKDRIWMIKTIVRFRRILAIFIGENFFSNNRQMQLFLSEENVSEERKKNNQNDQLENYLNEYFNHSNVDLNKSEIENLFKRLYDIDCQICPGGDEEIESKDFGLLTDSEKENEIIFLRLILAGLCFNEPFRYGKDISSKTEYDGWAILKNLESACLAINPDGVSEDVVELKYQIVEHLNNKIKTNMNVNEEKLRISYVELLKISSGTLNDNIDVTKSMKEFDNTKDLKGKIILFQKESNKIVSRLKQDRKKIVDNEEIKDGHKKIEQLLNDIENHMSMENDTMFRDIRKKIIEIRNEVFSTKENTDKSLSREEMMNYLNDIAIWIEKQFNWIQKQSGKLINNVKKLNTKSDFNKQQLLPKTTMSTNEHIHDLSDFENEKEAFEKAFAQLEDKIKELKTDGSGEGGGKGNNVKDCFISMDDIGKKSDDDLRQIVLSAEKELAGNSWTEEQEKEAYGWLMERSNQELLEDCRNLFHKMLTIKIDDFLKYDGKFGKQQDVPVREDQYSELEEEINRKLLKYQELCDTVDRLKIPQSRKRIPSDESLFQYDAPIESKSMLGRSFPVIPQSGSRSHSCKTEDEIDLYFQQRLDELQSMINYHPVSGQKQTKGFKNAEYRHESDVIVDGFDIEKEKTPRYYSMKLQDFRHERKEDEMVATIYNLDQERMELIQENSNLKQQIDISQNIIDNQNSKLQSSNDIIKYLQDKIVSMESGDNKRNNEPIDDMRKLHHDNVRLSSCLLAAQHQLDQQNTDLIGLSSSNENLKHDFQNSQTKYQCLERSYRKLEDMYIDLVHHFEIERNRNISSENRETDKSHIESEWERKYRSSEKDKIELAKKLDIIDRQNSLLKNHCEKLDSEILKITNKLGDSQTQGNAHRRQIIELTETIDAMKRERTHDYSSKSNSLLIRSKDDEITRLKNKIVQLETKAAALNESTSQERLRQEIMNQKDKEIHKLKEENGYLLDQLDETKAQLDVKEYECKKLQSANRQMQNQLNDAAYFPPPGFRIVKDTN